MKPLRTLGSGAVAAAAVVVVAVAVAVVATIAPISARSFSMHPDYDDRYHLDAAPDGSRQRIVLWGDSLAWEAQDSFVRAVGAEGADVRVRTFGGTAICDWIEDFDVQLRDWAPTTAVLAFSGNAMSSCMRGRDATAAYRHDATVAATRLTAAGVRVVFAVAPPRPDQPVAADGSTELERIWHTVVAADTTLRAVVRAGSAVTDAAGRWTDRLPCSSDEPCRPDGTVVVRGPDGIHFCPVVLPPMTHCPVPAPGAGRYGTALAQAAFAATDVRYSSAPLGAGGNANVAHYPSGRVHW